MKIAARKNISAVSKNYLYCHLKKIHGESEELPREAKHILTNLWHICNKANAKSLPTSRARILS